MTLFHASILLMSLERVPDRQNENSKLSNLL